MMRKTVDKLFPFGEAEHSGSKASGFSAKVYSPIFLLHSMENKLYNPTGLELINLLLESVNSKEEFDFLLAEKGRLLVYIELEGGVKTKWKTNKVIQ